MVSLKKRLALLTSAFVLIGCASKFDAVEHGRLVDVQHHARVALSHNYCSSVDSARKTAEDLNYHAGWLSIYSQHVPKNESMQKMSAELQKITQEFAQRYQQPTAPSRVYCELKLKNIISVTDVMQRTNARRAR